ncbi:hypothetical protein [Streptomyces cylindrosporus]|uniref:HEAT repeat domain-containing protein n=1 Tax=Streptomyces cylindrosporus TaxID=2927583 RepID=A0ABS9YHK2_9ACTN|nr:hypothetical protein [Streptomyces cylindrosporus]MCI3276056.1 hypothetical protein [Streptomyces cylindrosporus]
MADIRSPSVRLSTKALLRLTCDDPDRAWVEAVVLDCLSPGADPQVRALAVTCLGHLARIRREVSGRIVRRLEELLDDPVLGGRAEDALDDIAVFTRGKSTAKKSDSAEEC